MENRRKAFLPSFLSPLPIPLRSIKYLELLPVHAWNQSPGSASEIRQISLMAHARTS